jgi:outer membrane protein TolC
VAEGGKEVDFGVSAGAQHARLSGQSYLQDEQLPVADIGDVGAEMNYQIDLFGRIRRQIEAARADEEALAATQDAVKVTVAADVARAYVGVCAAHAAEDLAQRAITLQGHLVEINRRLVAAGRSATPDVTAAQGRLAQAQALLPTYRAAARAALYRLAALTGKVPADYPREAESCRAVPELHNPLPVGDGAALLRRRPDVRAAERQLAGATARIGVATADLYPSIGIGLSAGSTGFVKDLGLPAANRWSIGGLLHWSIPAPVPAPGSRRPMPAPMPRWPISMALCLAPCAKPKPRWPLMPRTTIATPRWTRHWLRPAPRQTKRGACARPGAPQSSMTSAGARA